MTTGPDEVADPARSWSLSRPDARRSLILCALGALAGLVIAGFGLFTAQGTRVAGVPAEDVALVNGTPILMSDYVAQLRALHDASPTTASPAQQREVLDAMIREELYVQRGIELGLPTDDTDTRAALVGSTEAQVAADALASKPEEKELRAFYAAHNARYASDGMMELAALTAPSRSGAVAAVAALRAGAPLTAAGARFGLKTTGKVDDGLEFYFAARIHLGPRAFAVAERMRAGEVSDPIDTADGPTILVMKQNRRPVPQTFDTVRARVSDDYVTDAIARLQAANERFLRKRADVQIARALR